MSNEELERQLILTINTVWAGLDKPPIIVPKARVIDNGTFAAAKFLAKLNQGLKAYP